MSIIFQPTVVTLGLFEKRIDGDDCLMELARQRFQQAGMGAEMYAGTPDQLEESMSFRPSAHTAVIVHLARDFNLADPSSRKRILDLAARFAGRVRGFVLHDHAAMVSRKEDCLRVAWEMETVLEKLDGCPLLFIEYAAGLDPADFAGFFTSIRDLDRISACIDIGHVGIRQAQAAYERAHGGEDVCALKSRPARLPQIMGDIEAAVRAAPPAVVSLIEAVGSLHKPVHLHLHDAHPLSNSSFFGVADHLSFLAEVPLLFEYLGRRSVAPMFGPAGLAKIMRRAIEMIGPCRLSATLEIHPTTERLALGDAGSLFGHWADKTNAEMMNHWLSVLSENHQLLRRTIREAESLPAPD